MSVSSSRADSFGSQGITGIINSLQSDLNIVLALILSPRPRVSGEVSARRDGQSTGRSAWNGLLILSVSESHPSLYGLSS